MVRVLLRQLILLAALTSGVVCRAQVKDDPTIAWTLQLIRHPIDSYQDNVKLVSAHPEESFAIVRDHWNDVVGSSSKQSLLIAFKLGASPHLLEVLDLAATDENANVRYAAQDQLIGFAYRLFTQDDFKDYLLWHKSVAGKTQTQIVVDEEKAFFTRLSAAKTADERSALLNILMRVDFASNLPLSQTRRDVGRECKALDVIGKMLSAPENPTVLELYAVHILQPTEQYLERVVAPLARKPFSGPVRYAALSLLSTFQNPAAAEIMSEMLSHGADPDGLWILRQALTQTNDPRMIPILIGVLAAEDDGQIDELLQYPLQRMTHTFDRELHDGGWWRLWWRRNHSKYPEVSDIRIPRFVPQLRSVNREPIYRRQMRRCEIYGDDQRAYWLICPGYIAGTAGQQTAPPRKLGLIVALGAVGSADDLAEYWAAAGKTALDDGYYIAVPVAPDSFGASGWVTAKTHQHVSGAAFTTEAFVNDILEDVCRTVAIDRDRCFLHGVGDGGMAAYACSLVPNSPFHGFYILASGFKSIQLPALTAAKGRKYYLQNSAKDAAGPPWQAEAAGEMLRKNGAIVKTSTIAGDHGYKFEGDAWKPIVIAMAWLDPHRTEDKR